MSQKPVVCVKKRTLLFLDMMCGIYGGILTLEDRLGVLPMEMDMVGIGNVPATYRHLMAEAKVRVYGMDCGDLQGAGVGYSCLPHSHRKVTPFKNLTKQMATEVVIEFETGSEN
jgi:hypothetical protein